MEGPANTTERPPRIEMSTSTSHTIWFARKDSNLNFQSQNLTCYHYTTGESSGLLHVNGSRDKNPHPNIDASPHLLFLDLDSSRGTLD